MNCKKCGAKLEKGDVYCSKCGEKVDEVDGKDSYENAGDKKKHKTLFLGIVIIVLVFIVAAFLILLRLCYKDKSRNMANVEDNTSYDESRDIDEYYKNNSKIKKIINATESSSIQTEKESYEFLEERGFVDYDIVSEYSSQGTYYDEECISENGSAVHPIYHTYHVTSNGDVWTIYLINGQVLAYPASYIIEDEPSVPFVLSETSTITSYDSNTNRFFITVPNADIVNVVVVNRIDTKLLESYSFEGGQL